MAEYKNVIRPDFGSKYNHELLNGLFYHPYTKIDHVVANMQVSRQTASKYLDRIVALGLLKKEKNGQGELLYQHPPDESLHRVWPV